MVIDEKKYRQFMAALSALIDLFPDEAERKLKQKREAERADQDRRSVEKMD